MQSQQTWVTSAALAAILAAVCGCGSGERVALERGDASGEAGEFATAILHYTEAIDLDPDSPTAYAKRGAAYLRQAEYREAAADFDEAIRLAPEDASLYMKRGLARLRLREYQKAIADFDVVIDASPKAAEAYARRGEAHLNQAEFDQAIEDLSRAIELDEKNAGSFVLRGRAYVGIGKAEFKEAAEADFTEAIGIRPTDAYAYWNRARVRESMDDPEKKKQAELDRQRAVSLDRSLDVPTSSRGKQAIAELRGDREDVLKPSSLEPDLGN